MTAMSPASPPPPGPYAPNGPHGLYTPNGLDSPHDRYGPNGGPCALNGLYAPKAPTAGTTSYPAPRPEGRA